MDFKIDKKLRKQIKQANLRDAQERVETQLEAKQVTWSTKAIVLVTAWGGSFC